MTLSQQDWHIRTFIYTFWINTANAPKMSDIAAKFALPHKETQESLERLNTAHHIFLDPDSRQIRMANPLSAIESDYRVKVGEHWLFANCAWDTLGIAAMTERDVLIEAQLPRSEDIVTYHVKSGKLIVSRDLLVNFSLPVNRWYDDLIHT